MQTVTIFDTNLINGLYCKRMDYSTLRNNQVVLEESRKLLFRTFSIFPFDLFPDTISIDEYKVNIIIHNFFMSEMVHSVPFEMIRDIEIEAGPFFATLKIVPDGYMGKIIEVNHLKKREAIKAREIIQGLMIATKRGIKPNKSNFSKNDLLTFIKSLGSPHKLN